MVKLAQALAMLLAVAPVSGTTMAGAPALANLPKVQG
jgi:hypothetical protein